MTQETSRVLLLEQVAEYWTEFELNFVETQADIRRSLLNFNADLAQYMDFAHDNLRQFTYWVFDPQSGLFGPNKFVGFCDMTIPKYILTRQLNSAGQIGRLFDGGRTRLAIEKAAGKPFAPDRQLRGALQAWAVSVLKAPDVFGGCDPDKWQFLLLEM